MTMRVGVDGCRFGWVAVFDAQDQLRYRLFRRFDALAQAFPTADILVDIPIGLPWRDCPVRPCDTLARKCLGRCRASSVFPAPSRAACGATDIADARAKNSAELGRSLSAQAWGICAKVAEVDRFLLGNAASQARVREVHPEVCFWALNGRQSMQHSKGKGPGSSERLAVLTPHEPRSQALLDTVLREQLRRDVQPDDVLDALVAFVTAAAGPSAVRRLQGQPARDQVGLPMEMLHL